MKNYFLFYSTDTVLAKNIKKFSSAKITCFTLNPLL